MWPSKSTDFLFTSGNVCNIVCRCPITNFTTFLVSLSVLCVHKEKKRGKWSILKYNQVPFIHRTIQSLVPWNTFISWFIPWVLLVYAPILQLPSIDCAICLVIYFSKTLKENDATWTYSLCPTQLNIFYLPSCLIRNCTKTWNVMNK